jgi:hypothetical protein
LFVLGILSKLLAIIFPIVIAIAIATMIPIIMIGKILYLITKPACFDASSVDTLSISSARS